MVYEHSEQMKMLAELLIDKLPDLAQIKAAAPNIAYMTCDTAKRKNGSVVFGDCEKVKPQMHAFMGYDYIITFYSPNILGMTFNQIKMLMYHELLHVDCVRDDLGELTCKIRQHTLQDFACIVDKYGNHWATEEDVPDILEGME